jgi:hypothetical protein
MLERYICMQEEKKHLDCHSDSTSYVYDLDDDSELATHITERLAQIRALALAKYREAHS